MKNGMKNTGLVLASRLDVDGAFNHTTKESIVKGAEDDLVSNLVSRWLWHMLSCRRVKAHWGSHSEERKVGKGCPQGRVLSPTMWCLVIDELIRLLNEEGFFAQAYTDDILILVKADDEHALAGLMQHALGIVQSWCESVRLSVNPDKVNMILFTTRYKVKPIGGVHLGGKPLKLVNEAKYLRVTLDSNLIGENT